MASPHAVQVLELCRIAPPSGSVSTTSIPLSYFDIVWISQSTVQRLFFYEVNHSKTHFLNTVLPNLKHSLSLTLQHFFPLAGNLTWPHDSPKPTILYVDGESAVSLTVAESDYDFNQLSGNHPKDTNVFYPLVPELATMSESENRVFPVFALQITLFPNRGVCIGVTYHHTVADDQILIQFVKSWASVCRSHGDTSFLVESPLYYDRSIVNDTKGIDMIFLDAMKKKDNITRETFHIPTNISIPVDKVRATFVLKRSAVMRIKKWVFNRLQNRENIKGEQPLRLSTFVITCAYVWVCLIKARRDNAIDDSMEVFGFAVDCRAKFDPPLPLTYFGNCLRCGSVVGRGSEFTGEDGIAIAAERIAMAITTIKDGEGILKEMERNNSFDFKAAPERFSVLTVAGSTKLGVYETDFGWGVPKKTEVVSIATTGAISLTECPYEIGAVEIGLVRDKMQMEAFTSLFAKTMETLPPFLDE